MLRLGFILISIFLSFSSVTLADVEVEVSLEPNKGSVNDVFVLEVRVLGQDANSLGEPEFEENDSFEIRQTGSSQQHMLINGQSSFEIVFSYLVYPKNLKAGEYQIPQGYFSVAGKKVQLKQPKLTISNTNKTARKNSNSGIDFTQAVSLKNPYVGQQILYRTQLISSVKIQNPQISEIELNGFWRESFGKARDIVRYLGNQNTRLYVQREALFPVKAGKLQIPQRSLSLDLLITSQRTPPRRRRSYFNLWSQFHTQTTRAVPKQLRSQAIELNVRPLPPSPYPKTAYVPVGFLNLKTQLNKKELSVGESATLIIQLEGNANLRPLELPDISKTLQGKIKVYQDKPSLSSKLDGNDIIFSKTFSLALVPQIPGEIKIPEIKILSFNPERGKYVILSSNSFELKVSGTAEQTSNNLPSEIAPTTPAQGEQPAPAKSELRAQVKLKRHQNKQF